MSDLRLPVPTTLAGAVWPERASRPARVLRAVVLAVLGTAILTFAARVQVPVPPVPFTLQSLAVLLIGAVYGGRLGSAAVALYLLEGAVGLPVFAGTPEHGIGIAYMMGRTGGFLLGFLVAAALVGTFAERGADRSSVKLLAAMAGGQAAIFLLGFAWLATFVGRTKAYALGVEPFLPVTAVELALGSLLVPAAWNLLPGRR